VFYDQFAVLHRANVDGIWAHAIDIAPLDDVLVRR
jgi:hypothetical protein